MNRRVLSSQYWMEYLNLRGPSYEALGGRSHRYLKGKGAPPTLGALSPNLASVGLDHMLGDRQAKASSFAPLPRLVHLVEALKDTRQVLLRYPNTCILQAYEDRRRIAILADASANDDLASLGSKLDSVV